MLPWKVREVGSRSERPLGGPGPGNLSVHLPPNSLFLPREPQNSMGVDRTSLCEVTMPGPGGVASVSGPGCEEGDWRGEGGCRLVPWQLVAPVPGLLLVLHLRVWRSGGQLLPRSRPQAMGSSWPGQQPHHQWDRALGSEEVMLGAECDQGLPLPAKVPRAPSNCQGRALDGCGSNRSTSG